LTDTFEKMVLLFTDKTADEVKAKATAKVGAVQADPVAAFEKFMKRERKDLHANLHLRVLEDLLDEGVKEGVFLAYVEGKKYAPALLAVDPRGVESTGLASLLGGEETAYYSLRETHEGFWYLSHLRSELAKGSVAPHAPALDGLHYSIDSRIKRNADLEGTTVVRLKAVHGGTRVVPLTLAGKLRITEAGFAKGEAEPSAAFEPAAWVQEDAKEDPDAAVILASPLAAGEIVSLRLTYKGDSVLEEQGDDNFAVRARESWYPNLGAFSDPSTFDLTFRVPKKKQVVAVGTLVDSKVDGAVAVTRWKADRPIRVAGFNYGVFKKLEKSDKESGFTVRVYTNPGEPDIARVLKEVVDMGHFDTTRLADSAMVDGLNAARTGIMYFGGLPEPQVAISQQSQWSFGQSWPSLIFLPYIAFLDSTTRFQVLGTTAASDFVDQVGYHEFAHQWWGHLVGWASYHDQWLSEGFAEFSAALVLHQTAGMGKYNDFWENAGKRIVAKPAGSGFRNDEVGPITQGWRLESQRTPGAYQALVYEKGAYVLHMLRMLMWDVKEKNPDARFIETMKDFVTSYSDKNPTTADFQKVVERHMTPDMNATGDGKLDWFFGQWVYGTEIPKMNSKFDVTDGGDGVYKIAGEVSVSGVSDDFRTLVPLYVDFGGGAMSRLGTMRVKGTATVPVNFEMKLPKKPKKVLVNAMHDVLVRG
ncbi:MAG TPA: M1 family aminopeptidase, partial [Thermoanaerobaculia bacterium]|nr:M1 family aminopeptidase [Thermoanaerobaculia bacterium]